ncbi:NUDIX domain-containing protein [Lutibacter oceani]|uniref:NUDIX domain-containing protein n=1 Tax=Lutibacter oceani TaxID=1853311 RepID=A0A3D9RWX2_9FLAO|nr:CoA pyrophosphatase [Lutibacter oceani]REE82084.1 NUDIX domain-containing protein [Lutibacter oceani]
MDYSNFKKHIQKLSNSEIGGLEAQFKLAPKLRKQFSEEKIKANNPKKAAVLVIFYPNNSGKINFLLTLRASYNGTHSAQISFPGGKFDLKDTSLEQTALREAFEEVGIIKKDISIFKQMTDVFIPPSNFIVTPYLSYIDYTPIFTKNHEVEDLIEINVSDFLCDSAISSTTLSTSYAKNIEVPCFKLNNYIVWGATAMMLSEIKELIKII